MAEKHYLELPVKNGASKRMISVQSEGREVYRFDIELAVGDMTPDYFAVMDLSRWTGKTLTLDGGKFLDGNKAFRQVTQSEQLPNNDDIYSEKYRPQFHFTSKIGWLNDPNGLVYHEGEWHLFYQHNPYGTKWGNMHWGHAVSKDLLHWKELGDAIYQNSDCKAMAFSGSAVIDHRNSSGFGRDGKPPLVIALTDTGAGESIGYSNDNGRSHDLKKWEFQSRIEGYYECTDLFELPVIGEVGKLRWLLYAADGRYAVGQFDGKVFTPEHEGKHTLWYGNFSAAQTYDNAPKGRRVQIGWEREISFPEMPFSKQMSVPVELSLHSTPEGVRMFAEPVAELKTLRGKGVELADKPLTDVPANLSVEGEGLDVEAEFKVGTAAKINLGAYNSNVSFDAGISTLEVNGLKAPPGRFSSREIELATYSDVAVRYICGGDLHHDHDTICEFRVKNREAFKDVFVKVLMLKPGVASVDPAVRKVDTASSDTGYFCESAVLEVEAKGRQSTARWKNRATTAPS